MKSRGFTLTELLVTMVVMAILGTALARIIIKNSQFVSRQDAMMEARGVSRAAVNVLSPELRLISGGGLIAAHRDSVRARVPFAFGVTCLRVGAFTYGALLPTDSAMYASAAAAGIAWRSGSGYAVNNSVTVVSSPSTVMCTAASDSIQVLPGGRVIRIGGIPGPPSGPAPGTIFYVFQNITYRFRSSADLLGRVGLWRRTGNAASYEELVAPFDTSARFAFLIGPNMQVDTRNNVGSGALDSIRGLELRLVGASQYVPQGTPTYQTFDLRTSVAFLNRTN